MSESQTVSRIAGSAPRRPSVAARLLSSLVRLYLRHAPLERGKWWLRRNASPWLVARLDTGPWIRVSGVAEFEWSVFEGGESRENRTAALFTGMLAPDQTILDVGSNVGYYALTAAARVGPSGHILAFEPGPAAAARLRENTVLNGLSNLTTVETAISDRPGTLRFNLGEDSEGGSLYDAGPGAAGTVEVPVATLDAYVEAAGLPKVDLIKIDTEGAEVGVLRGARRLLSGPNAPPVIIEANPVTLRAAGESIETLRAELESNGYTLTVIEAIPWRGEVIENWLATKPHRARQPFSPADGQEAIPSQPRR